MCVCVHMCVCVSALVYHSVCEEVRGLRIQDWIVVFCACLPSCGLLGLNSGLQAWLQAPSPAKPSHLLLSGMVKVEMRDDQLPHSAATEWKKRLCSTEGTAAFGYRWLVSVGFQYLLPESHLFSITTITKQYLIDVCLTQSGKARYKYYDWARIIEIIFIQIHASGFKSHRVLLAVLSSVFSVVFCFFLFLIK